MNPTTQVATSFVDMATQLMNTLSDAWPGQFQQLDMQKPHDQLIVVFIDTYGHLFDRATKKDISIFQDPVFAQYNATEKLTQIDVNILWQYIVPMVKFATMHNLYKGIPNTVMDVISGTITDIKSQIDSGTLDMQNLNPFALGQSVMAKMDPNEITRMTESLLGNNAQMEQMMKSMSVLLGGMTNGSNAASNGPNGPNGMPDLSALAGLLGNNGGDAPDLSALFKMLQDK